MEKKFLYVVINSAAILSSISWYESHQTFAPEGCRRACQLSVKDSLTLDSVCLIFGAAPLLHTRVLLHCVSNEFYFVSYLKVLESPYIIVHM